MGLAKNHFIVYPDVRQSLLPYRFHFGPLVQPQDGIERHPCLTDRHVMLHHGQGIVQQAKFQLKILIPVHAAQPHPFPGDGRHRLCIAAVCPGVFTINLCQQ